MEKTSTTRLGGKHQLIHCCVWCEGLQEKDWQATANKGASTKELVSALGPSLETIGELSERIREYERKLEEIAREHYPQTEVLRQRWEASGR